MYIEPDIALDCPYCDKTIYQKLAWFKKAYFTCPNCSEGLAESQFASIIYDLEQEMDASIEEMVNGQPESSCCGKSTSCGEGGCGEP